MKHEAICEGINLVEGQLENCIAQPPNCVYHWQSSVTQAVHLIQAAGLKNGRHKKNITTGFYLMSKGLVVTNVHRDFLRMLLRYLQKALFIMGEAATQNHHLIITLHYTRHLRQNQIHSFLVDESPNKTQ